MNIQEVRAQSREARTSGGVEGVCSCTYIFVVFILLFYCIYF